MTHLLKKYQEFQKQTEKKNFDLKYMAIGWAGEVGEVLNEIKKIERDDNGVLTPHKKKLLIEEMGDSFWYLSGICNKIGCSLEDIIKSNQTKLSKHSSIQHEIDINDTMGNYSNHDNDVNRGCF